MKRQESNANEGKLGNEQVTLPDHWIPAVTAGMTRIMMWVTGH